MQEVHREFTAPWGRLLKGMSGGVVLLTAGMGVAGSSEAPWLILLPLLLLLALPFMIRGYAVDGNELVIKRPGWSYRCPLEGLQSVEIDPQAMKGAIRLCGNGGLFSFTGLYRSKKLGRFRAFVNDLNRMTVLHFENRTLVVSPGDPGAFAEMLREKVRRIAQERPNRFSHKGTMRQSIVTQP
jgi:hypothetical protein